MNDQARLNVALCSDSNYFPHLATTVISLLETNRALVDQVFVVLTDIPESHEKLLTSHVRNAYALDLKVISSEHISLTGNFISGHVTASTYLRLHLGELIPESVSRVLYLDSDLIVIGDLSPLLEPRPDQSASAQQWIIAAVPEFSSGEHLRPLGFKGVDYFNAGVLWIDLDKWREADTGPNLVALANKFGERLEVWDQDVLNLYFNQAWLPLDRTLNWMERGSSFENAAIVHFASGDKPWKLGNRHPARKMYRHFRDLTPFPYEVQWDLQNLYRNCLPIGVRQQLQPATHFLRRSGLLAR